MLGESRVKQGRWRRDKELLTISPGLLGELSIYIPPALEDAPKNKHMAARKAFVELDGIVQPAPSPRFSETPSAVRWGITKQREDVESAVNEWLGVRTPVQA